MIVNKKSIVIYSEANRVSGGSLNVLQTGSDVRIKHGEFQLKIISNIRNPLSGFMVISRNIGVVNDIIVNFVLMGLERVIVSLFFKKLFSCIYKVVEDSINSENSSQLEGPLSKSTDEVSVITLAFIREII